MTIPLRLLLACFTLLLAGGCLEAEEVVVLNADGTGTFTATYVTDTNQVQAVFDRAAKLFPANFRGRRLPKDLPQPFHPNWFHQLAKGVKGVKITDGTSTEKEGVRTHGLQATFDTLESAAKGGLFSASSFKFRPVKVKEEELPIPTEPSEAGKGEGGGSSTAPSRKRWRLVLQESWIRAMGGPAPDEILPKFTDIVKGLVITRRFHVPGRIVSSNGEVAKDRRSVAFTNTLETLAKSKQIKMEIVFEEDEGAELKKLGSYTPNTSEGPHVLRFLLPVPKRKTKPKATPKAK